MKAFYLRDVHPEEKDLVLTNCTTVPESLIVTVVGSFKKRSKYGTQRLAYQSRNIKDKQWNDALQAVMTHLRSQSANCMLLSAQDMQNFCNALPYGAPFEVNDHTVYGFEVHTDAYFFFIACAPKERLEESTYIIRCYNRPALIAAGYEQDNKEI